MRKDRSIIKTNKIFDVKGQKFDVVRKNRSIITTQNLLSTINLFDDLKFLFLIVFANQRDCFVISIVFWSVISLINVDITTVILVVINQRVWCVRALLYVVWKMKFYLRACVGFYPVRALASFINPTNHMILPCLLTVITQFENQKNKKNMRKK